MSIGSLGIVGSIAGAPQASKGSEVAKNQEAAADRQRQVRADTAAENAAGIGVTDGENHTATDRDADGRLGYFRTSQEEPKPEESADDTVPLDPPQAIDPTGTSGSQLDLSG